MNTRKNKLICVLGLSGSGKTTTVRNTSLTEVVSYTDRAMREGEVHGVDYFFHTTEEIEQMEKDGLFAECVKVYGQYKASSWDELNNKDVMIIDQHGLNALKTELKIPVHSILIKGQPFQENRKGHDEYEFDDNDYDSIINNTMTMDQMSNKLLDIHKEFCSE